MAAFARTSSRVRDEEDEEDEEDDVADLFDEEFLEHMEALKQACQMMPGAEGRLKTSTTLAEDGYVEDGDGEVDDGDEDDRDLLRSVKESCGALDLVKASKNVKASVPNGEADFSEEDVQPISSLEDEVGGSAGDAASVDEARPFCSFLPGQLSYVEFDETPLPLVVHDRGFASDGRKAEVPESVDAVTEALLKNRACQESLREVLRQVEVKSQENREMQRRAVSLVEYQKACTRRFCGFTEVANPSVELIATKAGEVKGKGPPENSDVEVFRQLQSQVPAEFNVKKWTKKETQALAKGVQQQLQEIRVRAMMESWDSDEEGQDFNEQMRSIGESDEELKQGSPYIDWTEVARIYVSGRSPWECKLQWANNEHPLLNSKPWTKAEDKKLLSVVQAHDMVEWAAIAEELGTQRTPVQCAIRFQRSLNASILRSNWTVEEDEQLQAAVEKFGEKDWQSVAACLEGRLGSQCMSRWTKVLHPDHRRRGRWLAEEDTRLKWAVSVYGPRGWRNIAAHVPGRSDVQCRERWCNVLDPSVKIDEWIPEEDAKLEELVLKYGRHRWAAVGAELGRPDNQCFRHWKLLHPEHKISFKKDMVVLRAALATNFVGREKERPDLGLQDFLPPSGVGEEGSRRALPPSRLNTSKVKVPPKPRKRPTKKTKSPEPSSEVNENLPIENEVPTPALPSMVIENNGDVAEVCQRKRRAAQPGARASKKRKTPEVAPVVIEKQGLTAEASRDEKDAPLETFFL